MYEKKSVKNLRKKGLKLGAVFASISGCKKKL
jgi:hypothetical protein